ncbi:MAG: YbhB/YbcL family Raf kinase inhibitor-like protein [Chloroflexi bacterium]|nr:YbhB/YbcL family Raf kinase inhibitor-like protein [Chloroflexota bacterium]
MKKRLVLSLTLTALAGLSACGGAPTATPPDPGPASAPADTAPAPGQVPPTAVPTSVPTEVSMPFELTSSAFAPGESIPEVYSCDGDDISPPLAWGDPPEGTQSFALITDDPDAPGGTWVHWVLYNIPAGARSLPENIPLDPQLADGSLQGKNSWHRLGYGGPCPPSGTHRYFFKLYALDASPGLTAGAAKEELLQAMDGHILAQAELMGTYSR